MYNDTIVASVEAEREAGRDWRCWTSPGCSTGSRRGVTSTIRTSRKPDWWTRYELPDELARLTPVPDSRSFVSGPDGRERGGLFSLDGIHATTIAYGLMAQDFIRVMREAGVEFMHRDGVTPRKGEVHLDWNWLIPLDSLIAKPPRSLGANVKLVGWLDEKADVLKRLWAGAG